MSESGERFGGTAVGEPLGRIWGYKISHILQTEAEAAGALYDKQSHGYRRSDGLSIAGRKDAGDYEWCNRPGSKKTADGREQIDAEDMYELGNVMPHSTGASSQGASSAGVSSAGVSSSTGASSPSSQGQQPIIFFAQATIRSP